MAIALDSIATAANFGTSVSFSATNAHGTYMVAALAYGQTAATATWSGVTYNSVALTSVASANEAAGPSGAQLFTLANPATGANTFAATLSGGNGAWAVTLYTLTGVTGLDSSVTGTTATLSLSVSANAWIIDCLNNNTTSVLTAGAGQTNVENVNPGFGNESWCSTDGPLSAGSNSITWSGTLAQPVHAALALDPTVSTGGGATVTLIPGQKVISGELRRMV